MNCAGVRDFGLIIILNRKKRMSEVGGRTSDIRGQRSVTEE